MTSDLLRPLAERAQPPQAPTLPPASLGLAWRPLTAADVADLAALCWAVEAADAAPFRTSLEETAERFEGSWKRPELDTLAGFDASGRMLAFGQVTTSPGDEGTVRAFLEGGVHPDARGRGVGRALVAWMEGRGRQLLAESGKDLPARLLTYLEADHHGGIELFAGAGFTPRRYYTEMRRSLADDLPTTTLADGFSLAPWTPELDDAVRRAHNEAFADHWGSEPMTPEAWGLRSASFVPGWSQVVVEDATGEVAGYLMSARYEQDWPVLGHTFGYTSLLGVRRPWRGRGLAVALLGWAMGAYRADGMEFARLGVDTANPSGAHGLYAALGYEVDGGSVMCSIEI
ncbi:GNAT family N-acetyltransferase [Cellulomonas cellasea]|uniref:GNAT family N-acetyltransferase n=1 Tax=Cellulomonas cellasea TaxID=43670 RepID=UPI0025A42DCF|nr:GNAT family N-acetyltransferase [Cellulomonas cellasea]MDM8085442.1 GNAT family N-acetyltransferase [Cellulomonas cellasea]